MVDLKVKIRDGRVKGLSGVQVIQVSEKEKQWENQFLIPKDVVKTTYIAAQGCISCGILLSGTGARGVSSEHMENMEMFSCSPT